MEPPLTPAERDQMCLVLRIGCSRAAACDYVGVSSRRLDAALAADADFAARVRSAEAQAEVRHMGVVNKAAEDEKNWRSSAWWLQQRLRQRQREAGGSAHETLRAALEGIAAVIARQIPDLQARHAIVVQLLAISGEAEPTVSDPPVATVTPSAPRELLPSPAGEAR